MEARGVGEEQDERAGRDRVQGLDILPQELAGQEEQGHDGRPEHGRPALDEEGVEEQEDDQGRSRSAVGHPGQPEQGEQQQGDDRDVAAGDGEQVKKPALLEVADGRRVQPPILPQEKGFEHGPFRPDVVAVGGREPALEPGLDGATHAGDGPPDRTVKAPSFRRPGHEQGRFRRGPAVNVLGLEVAVVGEAAEIVERAARGQPHGRRDPLSGVEGEPRPEASGEGHAQPEVAAESMGAALVADRVDADEERVPVRFPFRRTEQGPLDVQIAGALIGVEGVAVVSPVVLGGAGGPGRRHGQEDEDQGRPALPLDVRHPRGREENGGDGETRGRTRVQGRGGGHSADEGRRRIKERGGAGLQVRGKPEVMAP